MSINRDSPQPEKDLQDMSDTTPAPADGVFLITGASSGIGAATARHAVDVGYRVVLAVSNRTEFVQAYLAVLRARLVAVPVNPRAATGELVRMIADCGARLVIADAGTVGSVRQAVAGLRRAKPSPPRGRRAGLGAGGPAAHDPDRRQHPSLRLRCLEPPAQARPGVAQTALSGEDDVRIALLSLLAFLRISTNPAVFNDHSSRKTPSRS